jgi:predicted alpha/beta-fold hydrolase
VGYSAGSNIVFRTLIKNHNFSNIISAAMCVCVTYDYKKSVENLEKSSIGRIYSKLIAMQSKVIYTYIYV